MSNVRPDPVVCNQGGTDLERWNAFSLPEMYKLLDKNCDSYEKASRNLYRCNGFEYAIKVKNNIAELPLVDYLWRIPHPNPSEMEPSHICFMYGETLWSTKNRLTVNWETIKDKAIANETLSGEDNSPSVRVSCPTVPAQQL